MSTLVPDYQFIALVYQAVKCGKMRRPVIPTNKNERTHLNRLVNHNDSVVRWAE